MDVDVLWSSDAVFGCHRRLAIVVVTHVAFAIDPLNDAPPPGIRVVNIHIGKPTSIGFWMSGAVRNHDQACALVDAVCLSLSFSDAHCVATTVKNE